MVHYMNLRQAPFSMISSGMKTIELRLLDEKRSLIRIGDTIVFRNSDLESATLTCVVKNLYVFDSFKELYAYLPLDQCGYLEHEIASASYRDMEAYYPPEKQKQYGVVGIEIELQN